MPTAPSRTDTYVGFRSERSPAFRRFRGGDSADRSRGDAAAATWRFPRRRESRRRRRLRRGDSAETKSVSKAVAKDRRASRSARGADSVPRGLGAVLRDGRGQRRERADAEAQPELGLERFRLRRDAPTLRARDDRHRSYADAHGLGLVRRPDADRLVVASEQPPEPADDFQLAERDVRRAPRVPARTTPRLCARVSPARRREGDARNGFHKAERPTPARVRLEPRVVGLDLLAELLHEVALRDAVDVRV